MVGSGEGWSGGQGRFERRSEVYVKISKKKLEGSGRGGGSGCQVG